MGIEPLVSIEVSKQPSSVILSKLPGRIFELRVRSRYQPHDWFFDSINAGVID
jgi:hypothetical protein